MYLTPDYLGFLEHRL